MVAFLTQNFGCYRGLQVKNASSSFIHGDFEDGTRGYKTV